MTATLLALPVARRTAVLRAGAQQINAVLRAREATDLDDFSELVGDIYQCALDPDRWPAVLRDCAEFVGAYSASLIGKGRGGSDSSIFYHDGALEQSYITAYFTSYARLDPTTGAHLMAPIDTPVSTADVMDMDEFHETRFYREWAAPQHLVDSVMVPVERSTNWAAMLALLLHESSLPVDECKRRAALIVPHIRRAAVIGKIVEQRSREAESLKDACDGLAAGMFLIGANAQLLHANAAGRAMLGRGGALDTRQGRLVAANAAANQELDTMLRAVTARDSAVSTRGTSVALEDRDGEMYVAHVLPLTGGLRTRAGAQAAVAALFFHRASLDVPEPPEAIAKAYSLTLSELRVLMAIIHVGGIPETAEALGIAETTAKTHLHRVFAKTGTSRQADLVKLVAGFAGPLSQ